MRTGWRVVSSKKTSESKLNETHIPFELLLPTVIFDVLVWGGLAFHFPSPPRRSKHPRWCAQWVQWMRNSGGESPWSIGSGGCLAVSLGAQNEKKAHTDGFSRMCAVIMCARKVPDCSLENRVPWSCFLIFIHGLLKRERVRESACMDDSYKSKGHLGVSFQSYQVSTCRAKFYTNTRVTLEETLQVIQTFSPEKYDHKTPTIGVATVAKEINILETWWRIEPRKWMLQNWTIKFFLCFWTIDLISNSWCNLTSKHIFIICFSQMILNHMDSSGSWAKIRMNRSIGLQPTPNEPTNNFPSKSKMVPWLGSSLLEAYWRFFLGCDIESFKVRYFEMMDHQLKEIQSSFWHFPPIGWLPTEILYPTDLVLQYTVLEHPTICWWSFECLRSK